MIPYKPSHWSSSQKPPHLTGPQVQHVLPLGYHLCPTFLLGATSEPGLSSHLSNCRDLPIPGFRTFSLSSMYLLNWNFKRENLMPSLTRLKLFNNSSNLFIKNLSKLPSQSVTWSSFCLSPYYSLHLSAFSPSTWSTLECSAQASAEKAVPPLPLLVN